MTTGPVVSPLAGLLKNAERKQRLTGSQTTRQKRGHGTDWPLWAPPDLISAYENLGIFQPWEHQAEAAEAIHQGKHTVLATSTGSGKSLAFWLPILAQLLTAPPARALYLSPTKALAADQLQAINRVLAALPQTSRPIQAATCDGDTPAEQRRFVQEHGEILLTNPDFLHYSMLPGHRRWARFFKELQVVVIDEGHAYRGVFGAHVAQILRRLVRVVRHYQGYGTTTNAPTFVLASATSADPLAAAAKLLGVDASEITLITKDTAPQGQRTLALWQPPLLPSPTSTNINPVSEIAVSLAPVNDAGSDTDLWLSNPFDLPDPLAEDESVIPTEAAPPIATAQRRSATAEVSELLADLAVSGLRTLAFTRSRRGAESVATSTRGRLEKNKSSQSLVERIAAYRGGYLPEERRALENAVRSGEILGLATTNALELGVDISGLDVVLIAGWPGTMMSLRQQAGRAGRAGSDGLVIFVARDDPLDQYLVTHPEAVFERELEAVVFDPENKYVIGGHLCAAAAEKPLGADELSLFGPVTHVRNILDELVALGALRRRATGWFWTHAGSAAALVDIRGAGGTPIRVVEKSTGRLLGTVDAGAADAQVHTGAVYVHQGKMFVVETLDLTERVALVTQRKVDYGTWSRELMRLEITDVAKQTTWGPIELSFGDVEVTTQVVSYERRRLPDLQNLGTEPLELPEHTLNTVAVWWTIPLEVITAAGITADQLPGALHAAEHAAIGLLPLFATCDRSDLGGLSTEMHADTGAATVFVYDGFPGGAGFASRGYDVAQAWLTATMELIEKCPCVSGCPACIQSPKCGNYNSPLEKAAAVTLLRAVLAWPFEQLGKKPLPEPITNSIPQPEN